MITVRQGSRGDAVRQLQELLGITADGIFVQMSSSFLHELVSSFYHGAVSRNLH